MRPLFVIGRYDFSDSIPCHLQGCQTDLIKPLGFEDTVDTLCNGVLIRITLIGHADLDVVLLKYVHVVPAAILAASVRVMDKSIKAISSIVGYRRLQGPERTFRVQGIVQRPTHNLMRIRICYQG